MRKRPSQMPYTIASTLTSQTTVVSMIEECVRRYGVDSPIRLIPRTTETDYVTFTRNDGYCYSNVGVSELNRLAVLPISLHDRSVCLLYDCNHQAALVDSNSSMWTAREAVKPRRSCTRSATPSASSTRRADPIATATSQSTQPTLMQQPSPATTSGRPLARAVRKTWWSTIMAATCTSVKPPFVRRALLATHLM